MAEIKSFIRPQKLYRYRSVAKFERELNSIRKAELFCSSYLKLNDPMEGLYTSSDVLKGSANYRAVRQAIKSDKASVGICSFSETHDHELMWAHYADKFSGICIEYSFSRMLANLPASVDFVVMFYDEHGPTVFRSRKTPSELAKMVLSYKNYRWLYEREWRMFAPQGKVPYSNANTVTHVFLGNRMDPRLKEQLEEALSKLKIKTSAMTIQGYGVRFKS